MKQKYVDIDRKRIFRAFSKGGMTPPKQIRKARCERAYWIYFNPKTSAMAFILTEDDLCQSDQWLIEYLKSVLNYDFNADVLLSGV